MKRFAQWWGRKSCAPESRCEHPENCVQREAQWVNDAIFCSALRDIKNEVSCPPVAFSQLYRQPLLRVAQLTQKVPVSGDDASPYFTYMVAQAVRALRCKREWLMLGDGHAESMAAWDAAWTFAVFSSALCYGWLMWEARWQFFWGDDRKMPVRWQTWSPSVGALPEVATHYRWEVNASCVANNAQSVRQGFVVAQWFDVDVMRWLQGYPKVMDSWWGAIGGEWACDDPLGKVLQVSLKKDTGATFIEDGSKASVKEDAVQPLAKEVGDGVCEVTSAACEDKTSVSLSGNFNETFGKVFLDMLCAGMRERQWTINQPDALMFRVESGWLVTMSLVQMFLSQQKEPMTCEVFVDVLQAQHFLACEKEKAVVDYLNLALTPPVCVRGVVVVAPVLDEDMDGAPYRFLKSMRQLGES